MIQDIEEESKTKFSMDVEFSFSFKVMKQMADIHIARHTKSEYNSVDVHRRFYHWER